MKLIVGLGNPGRQYNNTRHNIGFDVIDLLSDKSKIDLDRSAFSADYGKGIIFGEDVVLLKPQTYMNLSGKSVVGAINFFKIALDDVIVIYDDTAFDLGQIRLKEDGTSGGHNGIENIIQLCGSNKIKRCRVGIGQPTYNKADYVLGKFSKEEIDDKEKAVSKAVDSILHYLKNDFSSAMNLYNQKDK